MKVKVRWTVESFAVYEKEIDIPDEALAEYATGAEVNEAIAEEYAQSEIDLAEFETPEHEKSFTVEDRYVDEATILN